MNRRGNWTGKHTRQVTYEEMKEYGEFFRSMRNSIGLTIKQMAEELGVFKTTLYRWEKGTRIPQRDISEIEEDIRYIVRHYKN